MASGSYYNRYPIRCRTCYRLLDNKANDVEDIIKGYPKPTNATLVKAMDDAGLIMYCCRDRFLSPEIVYYNMENRPVIEGVRPVNEAIAIEAHQRLDGDFMFGVSSRPARSDSDFTFGPTTVQGVIPQANSVASSSTFRIIPGPSLRSYAGITPTNSNLRSLQSGVNQPTAQPVVAPVVPPEGVVPEAAVPKTFNVPIEVGIPVYNYPLVSKPVLVAVGARHHAEVISGVTFLAC